MIQSFADTNTELLFEGKPVRKIPEEIRRQAKKRLGYLHAATRIEDLYVPPSNDFHRVGQRFAISVNKQWRITFNWTDAGPTEVRFEDYH